MLWISYFFLFLFGPRNIRKTKWLGRILNVLRKYLRAHLYCLNSWQLISVHTAVNCIMFYWYNLIKIHILANRFMCSCVEMIHVCRFVFFFFHTPAVDLCLYCCTISISYKSNLIKIPTMITDACRSYSKS